MSGQRQLAPPRINQRYDVAITVRHTFTFNIDAASVQEAERLAWSAWIDGRPADEITAWPTDTLARIA